MNLDELQSVQSRERQIDSLQQLHDTFYEDAGRFVRQLREEREHVAADAEDPFDSADVQRLTDEINTAEQTVEAIYERRIGKIVKQASLEAAGMAADVEGLTQEEQAAFDRLVSTIEANRTRVLDGVLANAPGERDATESTSEASASEPPPHDAERSHSDDPPAPPEHASDSSSSDGVSESRTISGDEPAADGAGATDSDASGASGPNRRVPPKMTREDAGDIPVHAQSERDDGSPTGEGDDSAPSPEHRDINRVTVRITNDVGEILCVDDRAYELSTDDVVTLPKTNADPLIDHDAAVRLDEE